ncbi:MAG: galactokinase [Acidimicrobiales bacterium]
MDIRAWAPGRVNLIGEHTDYTGGLVFPMAIHLGTAVEGRRLDGRIVLRSESEADPLDLALPIADAASVDPPWGRYVAGVAAALGTTTGLDGVVSSTLPLGAGLSSSAALEVAVALALGAGESRTPLEVARLARAAEEAATGVPCGIMDQLASACGLDGHALLVDCATSEITPVRLPDDVRIVVIHSGQERRLADSAYERRRRQCEAAAAIIGPLRDASAEDVDRIDDDTLRRRARHVITENARVLAFASALGAGDLVEAGEAMVDSHRSLRDDFEVSTDVLDDLVAHLLTVDGVYGARLTGAGFGGCVVAMCRPDVDPTPPGRRGWVVRPSRGAHLA